MKYIFALAALLLGSQSFAANERGADLQYYLCDKPHVVRDALDLKKSDADERDVYLFETAKLTIFDHGLQIRLRVKNKKARLSIKRFDLSEAEFAREEAQNEGKCELDVHGKGQIRILSCSSDAKISHEDAEKLIDGKLKLNEALDKTQAQILKDAAVDITRLELKVLGPIQSRAWDFQLPEIDDGLALEQQKLPDGTRYIEFSVKTKAARLSNEIAAAERVLAAKGLSLCPDQTGQREGKLRALLNSAK